MQPPREIDEVTAELLLGRAPVGADQEIEPVVSFLADLRALALAPPAPVSPALAEVLADGVPAALAPTPPPVPVTGRPGLRVRRSSSTWRRVLVSATGALALAGGGITAAAAANLLPEGVSRVVASIVESLTPFEIDGPHGLVPAGETRPGGHAPPAGATREAGAEGETSSGRGGSPVAGLLPPPAAEGGEGAAGPGSTASAPTTGPAAGGGPVSVSPPQSSLPPAPHVAAPTPSTVPGAGLPPVPSTSPTTTVPVTTPQTTVPSLPLP